MLQLDSRQVRILAPLSVLILTTEHELRIYAGFDSSIEVFSVHRPGTGTRILTSPNKKSKDGMKGIISSISVSPSGTVYAVGSLSPSVGPIAIYDTGTDEVGLYLGLGDEEQKTVRRGVTQVCTSVRSHPSFANSKHAISSNSTQLVPTYSTHPSGAPRISTHGTYAPPVENHSRNTVS